MGTGLAKEQDRKKKYHALRKIERELRKAGVKCGYGRMTVFGIDENGNQPHGFTVNFGATLHAGNGECFGHCIVNVNNEQYAFLDAHRGLDRIKALYGNEEYRKRLPITCLAHMIYQIEQAVKQGSDNVFLHDVDGNRVNTAPGFGMESGQLFAYNEMQGDKPMLRIGQGVDAKDYVEFLPGMSVRWRSGEVIVARPIK